MYSIFNRHRLVRFETINSLYDDKFQVHHFTAHQKFFLMENVCVKIKHLSIM